MKLSNAAGENTFSACLQKGFAYYEANFFVEDIDGLMPKYYDYALYPIDATAGAQSILTLTRFGKLKSALKVATWLCKHLQRTDGHFAYQKHRYYLNAIPYMRWSSAWMYLALAFLLQAQAHQHGD